MPNVRWVLEQFDEDTDRARKAFVRFVESELEPEPVGTGPAARGQSPAQELSSKGPVPG